MTEVGASSCMWEPSVIEADTSSYESHRSRACAAMPGFEETTATEAAASSYE